MNLVNCWTTILHEFDIATIYPRIWIEKSNTTTRSTHNILQSTIFFNTVEFTVEEEDVNERGERVAEEEERKKTKREIWWMQHATSCCSIK